MEREGEREFLLFVLRIWWLVRGNLVPTVGTTTPSVSFSVGCPIPRAPEVSPATCCAIHRHSKNCSNNNYLYVSLNFSASAGGGGGGGATRKCKSCCLLFIIANVFLSPLGLSGLTSSNFTCTSANKVRERSTRHEVAVCAGDGNVSPFGVSIALISNQTFRAWPNLAVTLRKKTRRQERKQNTIKLKADIKEETGVYTFHTPRTTEPTV